MQSGNGFYSHSHSLKRASSYIHTEMMSSADRCERCEDQALSAFPMHSTLLAEGACVTGRDRRVVKHCPGLATRPVLSHILHKSTRIIALLSILFLPRRQGPACTMCRCLPQAHGRNYLSMLHLVQYRPFVDFVHVPPTALTSSTHATSYFWPTR